MFQLWLFLHLAGAIVAFGPTFVFPILEQVQRGHPEALAFASVVSRRIETRLILPFALSMIVSGTGLIVTAHIDPLRTPWLLVALAVYAAAIAISISLLPATARLVQLTASAGGGVSSGPTAEIVTLQRRAQVAGALLAVMLVVIVVLMIWRPGA